MQFVTHEASWSTSAEQVERCTCRRQIGPLKWLRSNLCFLSCFPTLLPSSVPISRERFGPRWATRGCWDARSHSRRKVARGIIAKLLRLPSARHSAPHRGGRTKAGLVEVVGCDTLFWTRLQNLTLDCNASSLICCRVDSFTTILGKKEKQVEVGFICATNRRLQQEIQPAGPLLSYQGRQSELLRDRRCAAIFLC